MATPRRRRTVRRPAPVSATSKFVGRSADAEDPRVVRARLAVQRFRRMVPGLTGFARMITRDDKVQVVISAGSPHTDGKNIYLRPPIELGDEIDHSRDLCDRRDLYGPLCLACKRQEEMMMGLYHEIAHIAYESFAAVSDEDKRALLSRALKEAGDPADESTRAGKIARRVEAGISALERSAMGVSYIGMAGLISPYLPTLINALEDWRVNTSLHTARPGTREAFAARYRKVMEIGVTELDGSTWYWRDRPHDAQAVVGVLLKLCGYDYKTTLAPAVVEALDSPEMNRAMAGASTVRSVRGVYQMAFGVLEAARTHGLLRAADDPEDDAPEPEPTPAEPDETDTGGDDDSMGEPGEPCDEGEPTPGDGAESDEPGDGDESADSDGEPGAEGGDTDEPADEDSTGESDGDASEDDEGAGSGAGDSDEAEGADSDAETGDGAQPGGETGDGSGDDSAYDGEDDDEMRDGEGSDGSGADSTDSDADTDIDSDATGMTGTGDVTDGSTEREGEDGTSEDTLGDSGPDAGMADSDGDTGDDGDEEGEHDGGDEGDGDGHTPADPDEVKKALDRFLGHDNPGWFPSDDTPPELGGEDGGDTPAPDPEADSMEVDRAIVQGEHFDRPSSGLFGVKVVREGDVLPGPYSSYNAWNQFGGNVEYGSQGMTIAGENILGPSLMRMRLAFADNHKRKKERNLKAGRVNSRVLGRRVATGDPRLFTKPSLPGKKDYFVVLGLDISGSTSGRRIQLMKSAILAQAELLDRVGVKFALFAHTGTPGLSDGYVYDLDIYEIKSPEEPWTDRQRNRLKTLYSSAANLDGHTMEFYRKVLDRRTETDRVIMYYTDGAMPAENYTEELQVLQDELRVCERKGYTVLAVGVENDEPTQYGLDTVRLDTIEDVPAVVKHLEKRLAPA